MALIQMPQDPRTALFNQAALNIGQRLGQEQQQQKQAAAIAAAARLWQQAFMPVNQQNQQSQTNYNSLNDLTSQLLQAKNAYTADQQNGTLTPEKAAQYTQQGNNIRAALAKIPGVNAGIAGADQTAAQFTQNIQPIIQSAYQAATTPTTLSPEQIYSNAAQAVKNSRGALDLNTALKMGETLGSNYNQQQQEQIKKLQQKHDSIIVGHLQSQFGDALKNKDYGTAAQVGMQLEQYGIKTPEWISKMVEQPKPSGHITLANGNLGLIMPSGEVQDTGQAVYIKPESLGRSGGTGGIGSRGGVSRVGGFTPTQLRSQNAKNQAAQSFLDTYNPNGVESVGDDGKVTYKPYTHAQQLAYDRASSLLYQHGTDTVTVPASDTENNWNAQYQNMLADIGNSSTDEERQQKINYYTNNGTIAAFNKSGFDVGTDVANNWGDQGTQQAPEQQQAPAEGQENNSTTSDQDVTDYNSYLSS